MKFDKRWLIPSAILLSLLLFLGSLSLPALYVSDGGRIDGFTALVLGGLAILYVSTWGVGAIGWYANLFLVHALVQLARAKARRFAVSSLLTAIIGLAIALSSALLKKVMVNEGGALEDVTAMGSGFYVWLGSFVVCIAADLAIILVDAPRSAWVSPPRRDTDR
jgi:hypothetical protein